MQLSTRVSQEKSSKQNQTQNLSKTIQTEIVYQPFGIDKIIIKGIYEGQFKDKMKHGKGIISFENGYTYEGDFVNDKKHGKGIINLNIKGILFKIKDMEKELLREFKNGFIEGQGTMIFSNGRKYQGSFKNNQPDGKGVLTSKHQKYIGTFKNGRKHLKGIFFHSNGDKYFVKFEHGRLTRKNGFFQFSNGIKYQGQYQTNAPPSKNIFNCPRKYYKFNGLGNLIQANGNKYKGYFSQNMKHGKGILQYQNGDKYVGQFFHNYKHGKGIYYYKNGSKYKGQFVNGYSHGFGTLFFKNDHLLNLNILFDSEFKRLNNNYLKCEGIFKYGKYDNNQLFPTHQKNNQNQNQKNTTRQQDWNISDLFLQTIY